MKTGERAQAILSEFSTQYLFVVMEDGEPRVGISDVAFARAILPELEDSLNHLEHKAKRREKAAKIAQEPEKQGDGANIGPE